MRAAPHGCGVVGSAPGSHDIGAQTASYHDCGVHPHDHHRPAFDEHAEDPIVGAGGEEASVASPPPGRTDRAPSRRFGHSEGGEIADHSTAFQYQNATRIHQKTVDAQPGFRSKLHLGRSSEMNTKCRLSAGADGVANGYTSAAGARGSACDGRLRTSQHSPRELSTSPAGSAAETPSVCNARTRQSADEEASRDQVQHYRPFYADRTRSKATKRSFDGANLRWGLLRRLSSRNVMSA